MHDQQSEIEQAIENDLTPEDRAILLRARDLHREKAKGRDLDNWLVIGIAHNVHIRLALRLAQTNKRSGSIYTKYLHRIMQHDGIDDRDKKLKSIPTALAWVCDEEHPDRLQLLTNWQRKMPNSNEPTRIWRNSLPLRTTLTPCSHQRTAPRTSSHR
jgi:hypothetical protein